MSTESKERHRSSSGGRFSAGSVTARFVLPLLLLLYALIGADQGAELSDTMYSVGNYAFFHESTGSWQYATWLSNLCGRLLYLICGGRLLYLNLLCRIFTAAAALTVYEALKKRIHPLLLFFAELAALGLCWSPSVILYQNLSALALTAAALLLYSGLMERSRRRMFAAGVSEIKCPSEAAAITKSDGLQRIEFTVEGDGFLYNMVRIMTGTLVEVGQGKRRPEDIKAIIEAGDRQAAGHTAPPNGLYLAEVFY